MGKAASKCCRKTPEDEKAPLIEEKSLPEPDPIPDPAVFYAKPASSRATSIKPRSKKKPGADDTARETGSSAGHKSARGTHDRKKVGEQKIMQFHRVGPSTRQILLATS